jgi:hypothetical protein
MGFERTFRAVCVPLLLSAATAGAEPKGRDITYHVTGDGLQIEVEGVALSPKAVPVQTPRGWIVSLSVRATARDQHTHKFLSPEHGALMVAAEAERSGKKERIGDERKGDGEVSITPDEPVTLERKVNVPIASGQSLTLFVGLWGLGRDDEERRPVKKLFVVKMVAGAKKPQPVITPPE